MQLKSEDLHSKKTPKALVSEVDGTKEPEKIESNVAQRNRSASPESQIPASPNHDKSLVSMRNWEHKFERLAVKGFVIAQKCMLCLRQ